MWTREYKTKIRIQKTYEYQVRIVQHIRAVTKMFEPAKKALCKKAFDTVPHTELIDLIVNLGIDGKDVQLRKNFYQ